MVTLEAEAATAVPVELVALAEKHSLDLPGAEVAVGAIPERVAMEVVAPSVVLAGQAVAEQAVDRGGPADRRRVADCMWAAGLSPSPMTPSVVIPPPTALAPQGVRAGLADPAARAAVGVGVARLVRAEPFIRGTVPLDVAGLPAMRAILPRPVVSALLVLQVGQDRRAAGRPLSMEAVFMSPAALSA